MCVVGWMSCHRVSTGRSVYIIQIGGGGGH